MTKEFFERMDISAAKRLCQSEMRRIAEPGCDPLGYEAKIATPAYVVARTCDAALDECERLERECRILDGLHREACDHVMRLQAEVNSLRALAAGGAG